MTKFYLNNKEVSLEEFDKRYAYDACWVVETMIFNEIKEWKASIYKIVID